MKNGMEMPPGEVSPSQETIDEGLYLEAAKKRGDEYLALVSGFTGKENHDEVEDPTLQAIQRRAKESFERQHILAQSEGFDARKILEQISQLKEGSLLEDASQYRLEELSEGLFMVYIKPDLYQKLRGGASGVAVKIKDGISFVMLPDEPPSETSKVQLEENIPHETHHLIWNFSRGDIITNNEQDPDFADAFSMYQDEVMARLSSGGGLSGYTHLAMLDPETKAQFAKDHPETVEKLTNLTIELNDLLQAIDTIRKQTDIRKQDFVMAVMEAKTFEQLRENLTKAKTIIEKQPITKPLEKPTSGGFFDAV